MESNGKFTLIVFNTCTREYEEVMVTEEVYRTYCRTRWNIKDNDQSFFDHEIQTSGMIGSQDGAYENFREFIDAINTPEHIILEQIKKEALYQAISALPAADQALVQGLFFKGQSELDYAREIGVSQPAVHKRKVRILKSLKKLLEIEIGGLLKCRHLPLYKREGNASHLFLENRISDCLNTFLTGPLLDRGKRRWRMRENHL